VHGIILTDVDPEFEGFILAGQNEELEAVKYLVEVCGINPAVNENEAIAVSCQYGCIAVVEYLLGDPKVDPSEFEDNHSIRFAAQEKHHRIVEILLDDHRVNPGADGNVALVFLPLEMEMYRW
jgi:hypothetical protein